MAYGIEIWRWVEMEKLEKLMMDHVRWLFGLKFCTSRYIIPKELLTDKLRVGLGIRAKKYKNKINEEKAGEIVKKCW